VVALTVNYQSGLLNRAAHIRLPQWIYLLTVGVFEPLQQTATSFIATGCRSRFGPAGIFGVILFIGAVLFLGAQPANAQQSDIIPFIELHEEFNDNIFFSVADPVTDLITTVSPGIDFVERTERLDASITGSLNQLLYLDNSELNSTDVYLSGAAEYLATPRLELYTAAGYIQDSRPDRDVDTTGFVQSTEIRKRWYFNLQGSYQTRETIFNNLSYRLETNNYQDPEFVDSVIHDFQFVHTWQASRWLKNVSGRFNLGYTHYGFEEARTDSFAGTIGAEWYRSERISLVFDLGARYLQNKFEQTQAVHVPPFSTTREVTTSAWGGIGNLRFVYRGEFFRSSVVFFNDLREAGGRGGTVLRTSLAVTYDQRISEKLRGYAAAGFNLNRGLEGETSAEDIDEQGTYFSPSLQYDLNDHWSFDLTYNVTWVKDLIDDSEAVRNKIFGTIRYQWPIWNR
jgi:hypothetical protein